MASIEVRCGHCRATGDLLYTVEREGGWMATRCERCGSREIEIRQKEKNDG